MTQAPRDFDVVVYGATGFTGRLVAEYLLKTYGAAGPVTWAMAGRSADKLAEVRDLIGAPSTLPLVVADAADAGALSAMAARTKVVITTAGPYQLYGSQLVAACAAAGCDYVDLAGESNWIAGRGWSFPAASIRSPSIWVSGSSSARPFRKMARRPSVFAVGCAA